MDSGTREAGTREPPGQIIPAPRRKSGGTRPPVNPSDRRHPLDRAPTTRTRPDLRSSSPSTGRRPSPRREGSAPARGAALSRPPGWRGARAGRLAGPGAGRLAESRGLPAAVGLRRVGPGEGPDLPRSGARWSGWARGRSLRTGGLAKSLRVALQVPRGCRVRWLCTSYIGVGRNGISHACHAEAEQTFRDRHCSQALWTSVEQDLFAADRCQRLLSRPAYGVPIPRTF